jgi:hypothetical protein
VRGLSRRLSRLEEAGRLQSRRRRPRMTAVFGFTDDNGRPVKALEGSRLVDYDPARHGRTPFRFPVRYHISLADAVASL